MHVKIFLEFLKMNINCGNVPEARDGYFTTYYSFNKIVLDIITEKFDIQVDQNTRNQATLLHDDIPGYDLPTIDFVNTTTDQDKDVSILEEDNSQIYAYLDNVLVHMIDKKQTAIFKSNQDFNENKEKISQYKICRDLASCISHMFLYSNGM